MGTNDQTEKHGGWTWKKIVIAFVLLSIGAIGGAALGAWRDATTSEMMFHIVVGIWVWAGVLSALFWMLEQALNLLEKWENRRQCRC